MTDESKDLETRRVEAGIAKDEAIATHAQQEARREYWEAEASRVEHERQVQRNQITDAADLLLQRLVQFRGVVNDTNADLWIRYVEGLARYQPGQPITIEINSPGGSVFAGLDVFGHIRDASETYGCHITTVVSGYAASMGGVLSQAGDTRLIRRDSLAHLHESASFSIGKTSAMEDELELMRRIDRHMAEIYASRSTTGKSAEEIYELFHRKEVWLSPEEAVNVWGFFDGVK